MAGMANSLTGTHSDAQGRPIFICGCGHSGTTLMLRTLRRVDGLSGPSNETNWAVFPILSHRLDSLQRLEAMISSQCRLVEKSPIHVFHLERLFEARQQCQVILCVRDARDVVASRKARGDTVERSLSKWIKSIKIAKKYSEDTRIMVVKYEDVVGDEQALTLAKLSRFLDVHVSTEHLVPGTQSCTESFNGVSAPAERPIEVNTRAGHGKLRAWQFNQPLYDGRGRWKIELNEEEIKYIEYNAFEEMRWCGYH